MGAVAPPGHSLQALLAASNAAPAPPPKPAVTTATQEQAPSSYASMATRFSGSWGATVPSSSSSGHHAYRVYSNCYFEGRLGPPTRGGSVLECTPQGPDGQQSKPLPALPSYASVQSDAAMMMLSTPTRVIVRTAPPSSAQAAAIEAASRKRQREQEEASAAQKRARQTQQQPPSTHSLLHLQQSTAASQQSPTQEPGSARPGLRGPSMQSGNQAAALAGLQQLASRQEWQGLPQDLYGRSQHSIGASNAAYLVQLQLQQSIQRQHSDQASAAPFLRDASGRPSLPVLGNALPPGKLNSTMSSLNDKQLVEAIQRSQEDTQPAPGGVPLHAQQSLAFSIPVQRTAEPDFNPFTQGPCRETSPFAEPQGQPVEQQQQQQQQGLLSTTGSVLPAGHSRSGQGPSSQPSAYAQLRVGNLQAPMPPLPTPQVRAGQRPGGRPPLSQGQHLSSLPQQRSDATTLRNGVPPFTQGEIEQHMRAAGLPAGPHQVLTGLQHLIARSQGDPQLTAEMLLNWSTKGSQLGLHPPQPSLLAARPARPTAMHAQDSQPVLQRLAISRAAAAPSEGGAELEAADALMSLTTMQPSSPGAAQPEAAGRSFGAFTQLGPSGSGGQLQPGGGSGSSLRGAARSTGSPTRKRRDPILGILVPHGKRSFGGGAAPAHSPSPDAPTSAAQVPSTSSPPPAATEPVAALAPAAAAPARVPPKKQADKRMTSAAAKYYDAVTRTSGKPASNAPMKQETRPGSQAKPAAQPAPAPEDDPSLDDWAPTAAPRRGP